MDRDDRGTGRPEGNGVLRVDERGARTAQQPWQRDQHPQLLHRGAQPQWLDSVRHELRVAGGRRDAEARFRRERAELAQEVAHVRLVTGAQAAEDVGIDDDERRVTRRPGGTRTTAASTVRSHV